MTRERTTKANRRSAPGRAVVLQRTRAAHPPLPDQAIALLGCDPDPVLATRFSVTTYRIREERRARGIPAFVGGGSRKGSGFDPVLGPGQARDRIKTVRLSKGEEQAQLEAAKRAGAKDWGTWIRDVGNAAAAAFRGAGSIEYRAGDLLERMQTSGVTSIVYDDPPESEPGA